MKRLTLALPAGPHPVFRSLPGMGGANPAGDRIGVNRYHLTVNGRPWLPSMGEFHYARYAPERWDEELRKIKAGGVDIVASYIFWLHHEEEEGRFDWSGRRDLRRFVRACARRGLRVVVRPGPFCHGESRNGGLPDWLYGKPYRARSNDPAYLAAVGLFYREIGRQLKGLFFKEGGPIVGIQIENEFMSSAAPWETTHNTAMAVTPRGEGGWPHMAALQRLARQAGMDAPLWTNTAWGRAPVSPRDMLPVFGGYGYYGWEDCPPEQKPTEFYSFRDLPNRTESRFDPRRVPYLCCEIGGGMQAFYRNRPVAPPESVECMHVVLLGSGSNLMGYYVYHGGLNPDGRRSFLNEHRCPRISYDFQAPLSEFGRVRPHYGLLRRQFLFQQAFGDRLAPMTVALTPEVNRAQPDNRSTLRWCVRAKAGAGFLFVNQFQDHVALPVRRKAGFRVKVPGGRPVLLPADGPGLTLRPGMAAILPFNFDLDGVRLVSATVQPLTRLVVRGEPHYFFFAPGGFPAEYAVDPASFATVVSGTAKRSVKGGLVLLRDRPGTGSRITFTRLDGKAVRVTTLTDEQSRQMMKARLAGCERLFLSESCMVMGRGGVELFQAGNPRMAVSVYPPVEGSAGVKAGVFARYTVRAERKTVAVKVRAVSEGKVAVRIPADALSGAHEVYLEIDYAGDTGAAYLDGRLIHDHFWNGKPWELALRPFAPPILGAELVLALTPDKTGKMTYSAMAAMSLTKDGRAAMGFRSIRAVVEYETVWKPG